MIDDGPKTIPDQKPGNGQAKENTHQRDNPGPFLARVLSLQPGSFDLAFLDSPRMEISLRKKLLVDFQSRGTGHGTPEGIRSCGEGR